MAPRSLGSRHSPVTTLVGTWTGFFVELLEAGTVRRHFALFPAMLQGALTKEEVMLHATARFFEFPCQRVLGTKAFPHHLIGLGISKSGLAPFSQTLVCFANIAVGNR